jgi:hypothetical protein
MAEITSPDVLKRAKRNCAEDGCRWDVAEPKTLSRFFGYQSSNADKVLNEFERLTYLAEAHWQLYNESLGSGAKRAIA